MQAFPTSAVPGRLHGVVRHYAWGSRTSIARLQGRTAPTELPEAELWFGAHEQAPSMLEHDGRRVPLDRVVADDPVGTLGARLAAGPARLPFLVKVLAAAEPLSLQLHPDAAQAAEGFAAEEAAGIPRAADQRRFRDPWPKPEVLVALEPFSALCGLRSAAEVVEILDRLAVVALAPVVARLRAHGDDGYGAAIADLLRLDRPERAALVTDLAVAARREHALLGPMAEVVADLATRYPSDAGVGVALLLRHHELAPGDALAVAPGVPHAYLHGVGLEVMGASDNVLRGGLTTKHVDVDEFCRLLATDTSRSPIARWRAGDEGERVLDAAGLGLRLSIPPPGLDLASDGPQMLVCVDGVAQVTADGASLEVAPGRGGVPAGLRRTGSRGRHGLPRDGVRLSGARHAAPVPGRCRAAPRRPGTAAASPRG
jgi:mannose-6-phosphate isomerase